MHKNTKYSQHHILKRYLIVRVEDADISCIHYRLNALSWRSVQVALVLSILQQLSSVDVVLQLVPGHKEVLLPVHLYRSWWSRRVYDENMFKLRITENISNIMLKLVIFQILKNLSFFIFTIVKEGKDSNRVPQLKWVMTGK